MIINSFTDGLVKDINNSIKRKKENLHLFKMTSLKTVYLLIFSICFLLGNFTSMLAIVLKDMLGCGIIFPISSCIFLYGGCLISIKCMYLYNKEKEFFERKIKYEKENTEQK